MHRSEIAKYHKKWLHSQSRTTSFAPTDVNRTEVEDARVAPACKERPTDISSLPPELLAEIFLYSFTGRGIMIFNPNSSPVNLTQTCHLWREVAIGTPQLWNVLHPTYDTPLDMIQLWISRASHQPLVLDFRDIYALWSNAILQRQIESIFVMLFSHASSVGELILEGPATICHPAMVSLDPSNFPQLQSVYWTCDNGFALDLPTLQSFEHFWSMTDSIPTLQSATISYIPSMGPWNHIAELELLRSPILESLKVLEQCIQLRKLSWRADRFTSRTSTVSFAPIVIPNLRHLDIYFRSMRDEGLLLDYLTLPNIHHIKISIGLGHPTMLKSMTQLLHRSNSQLHSFELAGVPSQHQDTLVPFFSDPCLNMLRRIVVGDGQMLEMVWAAFSQASFLPSLEDIQISVDQTLDTETVGSYLRTRELQGSQLMRVIFFVICSCGEGCPKLHPPWNSLRETLGLGMNIQVIPSGEQHLFHCEEIV